MGKGSYLGGSLGGLNLGGGKWGIKKEREAMLLLSACILAGSSFLPGKKLLWSVATARGPVLTTWQSLTAGTPASDRSTPGFQDPATAAWWPPPGPRRAWTPCLLPPLWSAGHSPAQKEPFIRQRQGSHHVGDAGTRLALVSGSGKMSPRCGVWWVPSRRAPPSQVTQLQPHWVAMTWLLSSVERATDLRPLVPALPGGQCHQHSALSCAWSHAGMIDHHCTDQHDSLISMQLVWILVQPIEQFKNHSIVSGIPRAG